MGYGLLLERYTKHPAQATPQQIDQAAHSTIQRLSCLSGWFVAEHGRHTWTIYGDLPTTISSSSIGAEDVALSLGMFVLLYTVLLILELYLMVKFARLGPSSLHTGRYFFEQHKGAK